jgi:hypothetical protein
VTRVAAELVNERDIAIEAFTAGSAEGLRARQKNPSHPDAAYA